MQIGQLEIDAIIIKTIKIFLLTYYCNFKLTNKRIKFGFRENTIIIIVAIIWSVIKGKTNYLISTLMLILLISVIYSRKNIENSILTTTISLSINYTIELLSIIVCYIIEKTINIYNNYFELLIITAIHITIIFLIFKIKKLKYGISYLQKEDDNEYMDLLILNISIVILFSVIIIYNSNYTVASTLAVEIITSALIMFITIKKSLNLYYKQKMLIKELEETKTELNSKNKEIEELEKENLTFKKRSHTLIHQQKSLEYKIQQIMMQTEISKEQTGDIKARLEKIAEEIYKEKENIELDKTGITEIDDILKYMQSECNKNKIEFILKIEGNIHQMTNNAVSKEELEILLADHIKNAIIAINHTDNINRTIMVKLGKIDSIYSINIYDTGAEFEPETLDNLGKKPSTTHAEEGGTGMGFMNTFETLEKYKASLTIEEYNKPSKDNYTKLISIKFDNKNQFKIKSYRR